MQIFIEKYRLKRGFSLSELEHRSGVAKSHIHNIENGTTNPTVSVLCKIAQGLNVPCCDLFSCD